MAAIPTFNFGDFARVINNESDRYPFYCVLMYTPMNGLDERMHKYVLSRWHFLNKLTGYNCLLVALEDMDRGKDIRDYKPEDVYEIARYLGAPASSLPCMVFFTNPQERNDTLILKLRDFLPDPGNVTDEELTDFFRALQSIIDTCAGREADSRIECLREGLRSEWPQDSRWAEVASKLPAAGSWLVKSVTTTSTIVEAVNKIVTVVAPLLGFG